MSRVKAGDNVGVGMIRDLRGVIEREGAGIGVFLTLADPSRPMVTEAAGAGQFELDGFGAVPRIQIVTIEEAMALRDRAVRLPARRGQSQAGGAGRGPRRGRRRWICRGKKGGRCAPLGLRGLIPAGRGQ